MEGSTLATREGRRAMRRSVSAARAISWWAGGGALLMILLASVSGCADGSPSAQPDTLAPLSAQALPRVRVHQGRLVDAHGRQVRVRGVNARVEGIFDVTFEDGRQRLQELPTLDQSDTDAMVSVGFNMLRLPINWSGVEPEEGRFDEAYLARVDAVLDWAKRSGLYVLIDVHQDAWSKHIGEDGAPLWAIIPEPQQLLQGPLTEDELVRRRLSGQVIAAFRSFWDNEQAIQERWLPMWRLIVSRWHARDEVIGFEPMNEPVFSDRAETKLHAFYAKAHRALRERSPAALLWVEPDALRNFRLRSPAPAQPFLDEQVVYSPHFYPQLANRRADPELGWEPVIRPSLEAMVQEAKAWGQAALVVGEWGADPKDPQTAPYARTFQRVMDELGGGYALWLWKESSQGSWGMHDWDAATGQWSLRPDALELFTSPCALAVPGQLVAHRWEPDQGTLTVQAQATGQETAGPLLYLPARLAPRGYLVTLNGQPLQVQVDPGSQRAVVPWPRGLSGPYRLQAQLIAP